MSTNEKYDIEGITISMGIVDAIPVLFFIGSSIIVSLMFHSIIFTLGAVCCSIAGASKVLWKLILAGKKKNLFALNKLFRILMPLGFLLIIVSLITDHKKIVLASIITAITGFPQIILFILGIAGMICMCVFAKKFDSSNAKCNWIEQSTNGVAQACFFIGLLIICSLT